MPDLYWANGRNAQGTLVMTKQVEKKDLSLSRSTDTDRTYYWQLNADYDRTFGDHAISGLLHFYLQSRTKSKDSDEDKNVSAVLKPIPRRYEALSGRVTYNYKQIYFAEFNIGYTGSDNSRKINASDFSRQYPEDGFPLNMIVCKRHFLSLII